MPAIARTPRPDLAPVQKVLDAATSQLDVSMRTLETELARHDKPGYDSAAVVHAYDGALAVRPTLDEAVKLIDSLPRFNSDEVARVQLLKASNELHFGELRRTDVVAGAASADPNARYGAVSVAHSPAYLAQQVLLQARDIVRDEASGAPYADGPGV